MKLLFNYLSQKLYDSFQYLQRMIFNREHDVVFGSFSI